jgi:hypothetical protein
VEAEACANPPTRMTAGLELVARLVPFLHLELPDLAFAYSQFSKFVQSPGPVHLAAAERALAYVRGTYNEGITYCDPGEERRNKLTGWVDSDFQSYSRPRCLRVIYDIDYRLSL